MTAEDKIESIIKVAKTKVFITNTPEDGTSVFNDHSDFIDVIESSYDKMVMKVGRLPQCDQRLNTFQKAKQYGIVIQAKA